MMKQFITYFFLVSVLLSCSNPQNHEVSRIDISNSQLKPIYSKGFSISKVDEGYVLNVLNPWQGANVQYKYLLTNQNKIESKQGFDEAITIPVSRVVCLSTTHIAFIDALDQSNFVVGVSGAGLISSPNVTERVKNSLVRDVGYEQSLNFELLASLKPDVVFTYGVGAEMAGYLQKLRDLKIPVVFIGDYLEEDPLGKAEWLKVFGLFTGREQQADSLFLQIENQYNTTKSLAETVQLKPNIFLNLPWKDVWYMPGGQGYMARLIEDAGGNYLLSHLEGSRSYPFSIETALEYGINADIWLNTGSYGSLSEISNDFPLVRSFLVFRRGDVFNSNKLTNPSGGNDFWESGVVNPHLILKDLVKIFHPEIIEHELVYYQKLK